jgi:hypothetical protein
MFEILSDWFSPGSKPHGHCLLCPRPLLWLYVASVSLVTFSYYMISIALVNFVPKRRDLAFKRGAYNVPRPFSLAAPRNFWEYGSSAGLSITTAATLWLFDSRGVSAS